MNVPAIAQKTFEESKNSPSLIMILNLMIEVLQKLSTPEERVKVIHQEIDNFNRSVFSHPIVKEHSPCKMGCSGCCHTQVSVTDDEALVLFNKIKDGLKIDVDRLAVQKTAVDDSEAYFKLSYEDRKCIFLDEKGACRVYEDRPSVCRTNAVLGTAEQCDTRGGLKPVRLVKTQQADMVIYAAFLHSKSNGSLSRMIAEKLESLDDVEAKLCSDNS